MAIKWQTTEENGKISYLYQVCVKARARSDRSIQAQKSEAGVLTGVLSDNEIRKKLQRIELRLYGDAREEVARREGAGILWIDLIQRWETEALGDPLVLEFLNVGQKSAKGYLQSIRDHTDGWAKKAASEINAADFEMLILSMRKTGYAEATIYNLKSAINCCFKWAIKMRMLRGVSVSPTYGCTISRKNSRRPEVLNYSQICHLLEQAKEQKHPWYSIWKLALHTGLRSGEAYALRVRDIDLEEKRIMLDTKYNFDSRREEPLKDHEWRQVPINEELYAFFVSLGIRSKRPEEYILPHITAWKNGEAARIIRAFCEEIGVTSICFHTLRACWATQLLKNGVAQATVMIMGGWADLETMQVYLRRAGVEIEGGTDSLKFERKERPGRVLKFVARANEKYLENEAGF